MDIQEHDGEDLITHLPELIINHILSRMPTRDAVRTSVLSRAWKYKWRCVSNVQINDEESSDPHGEDTAADFVNFVQRVVNQTHNVTSFCLENMVGYYNAEQFAELIGAILMRGVKSLVLWLCIDNVVVLPDDLIQNTSLEILELCFNCILRVPATASFPKLKRLYLFRAGIENNSSNDTMTLYLPLLEIIDLIECTVSNVKMMEIHAPVLTTYKSTYPGDPEDENEYSIKIISQKLVSFRLNDAVINEEFILVGQQVVQADLSYANNYDEDKDVEIGEHAQNLLTRFLSNVREFSISGDLVKIISRSTEGVTVPVFRHLVRLYVCNANEDDHLAKGLLKLLRKTPCLKFLSIACYGIDYDYTPAEYVPICMNDPLEEIEFKLNFNWEARGSLHLLNFLMENGRALKRTYIYRHNRISVDEITQYLLALPRSSTELLDVQVIL